MPSLGAPELIIIILIALLIFGPGKLPELGSSLGKGIREFRKATSEGFRTEEPPPPAPASLKAASQVCSGCGAGLPTESKYCGQCGAPVPVVGS